MIQKILFPVDFSQACAAMAPYVRRAADIFGAEVTIIHVCDPASHNGFELYVRPATEIADEHLAVAQQRLDSFLAPEFPAPACARILYSGEAAEQIAQAARAGAFDLIVMPTHAGRFRRMLLGSTTAKVLDDAGCPVMTTEHSETEVPRPLQHRVWGCAVGLSADSERVLRVAGRASAAAGAKLIAIHAAHEDRANDARRRVYELLRTVGCEAQVHIAIGPVKDALLDAVRQVAADALIVGRRPRTGALGRLRDLTYSLVRDSPVPVLSV